MFRWRWAIVAAYGLAATAVAVDTPLREATSPNDRYLLRIHTGRPEPRAAVACRASLIERAGPGDLNRVWDRILANDVAPAQVWIRNDARYVVTLDEFQVAGARHALVIYGPDGQMLRHFRLDDLLTDDDWPHVQVTDEALVWLDGAECRFADDDTFDVELAWGRTLRVDLPAGRLVGRASPPPARIAALLTPLADVDAAPQEAPAEPPVTTTDEPRVEEPPAEEPAPSTAPTPERDDRDEDAPPAGDLAAVPAPDPADPTDYLIWANRQLRAAGAGPAENYTAIVEKLQSWPGELSNYRAVMAGAEDALRLPVVQEWLESNAEMLAALRAKSRQDGRGVVYVAGEVPGLAFIRLPDLYGVRQAVRVLMVAGQRELLTGAADAGLAMLVDVLRVGRQVSGGGTIAEGMAGFTIELMAGDALADGLAGLAGTEFDARGLAAELARVPADPQAFERYARFDQATTLDMLQRLFPRTAAGRQAFDEDYALEIARLYAPPGDSHEIADLVESLRALDYAQSLKEVEVFYDTQATVVGLPYPKAAPLFARIDEALQDDSANALLKLVASDYATVYHAASRARTLQHGVHVLAALEAHRQARGEYPDSLEALGAELTQADALGNRPLVYRRDGDGFKLYSVGVDGRDDGGLHDPAGKRMDYVIWPRPGR